MWHQWSEKDICLHYELQEDGRARPCSNSAGNVCIRQFKYFAALHTSINEKVPQIQILGLHINIIE